MIFLYVILMGNSSISEVQNTTLGYQFFGLNITILNFLHLLTNLNNYFIPKKTGLNGNKPKSDSGLVWRIQ